MKIQYEQGNYPSGLFRDHPVSEILAVNRPIFFRRNLTHIAVIAEHNGIVPVLATFAHSPEFPKVAWSSLEAIRQGYDEMNSVIRDVAIDTGAVYFDFAAEFPTSTEYYNDGIHVNEQGARLQAKFFADFLEEQSLLPPV